MAKKPPLYPHVPKSRGNNTGPPPPPTLPTKAEMDELDRLLAKADGILMNWRFKMTPAERMEYPAVYRQLERAKKPMAEIADALVTISTELGFGPLYHNLTPP